MHVHLSYFLTAYKQQNRFKKLLFQSSYILNEVYRSAVKCIY